MGPGSTLPSPPASLPGRASHSVVCPGGGAEDRPSPAPAETQHPWGGCRLPLSPLYTRLATPRPHKASAPPAWVQSPILTRTPPS